MFSETKKLANGVEIPVLALGTWLIEDAQAAEAVKTAVELGYRHVDTAQAYGNERGVGEGIRAGAVPREQIFITSKVAAEHKTYGEAAEIMPMVNQVLCHISNTPLGLIEFCQRRRIAVEAYSPVAHGRR